MKSARAYSPGGISSFFEIVDREADGSPISDPLRIGARGGGFVIGKGVKTEVKVQKKRRSNITVYLNGRLSREAKTTEAAAHMILEKAAVHADVSISHLTELPIGCGYGTSAAGALSTALALCQALELNMTYNEIGQIAHVAEVQCKTGLGTVGPLMVGGHVVTVRAGAPGFNVIDRIVPCSSYRIVTGWFGPISKPAILANRTSRLRINQQGRLATRAILRKPTTENFLVICRNFAYRIGFMSGRLRRLILTMERSGAVGATQNMLGEAAHALVEEGKERKVYEAARRLLPRGQILSTAIDFQGARPIHEA